MTRARIHLWLVAASTMAATLGCEATRPPPIPVEFRHLRAITCRAVATEVCLASDDLTGECVERETRSDPYVPEELVGLDPPPCGTLVTDEIGGGLPPDADAQGAAECQRIYCGCLAAGTCTTCEAELVGWGDAPLTCTMLRPDVMDGDGRRTTPHPPCPDAGVFDAGDGGADAGDGGADAGDGGDAGDAGSPCPDAGPPPDGGLEGGRFQIRSYEWPGGGDIFPEPTVILDDVPAELMERDTTVPRPPPVIMAARELLYVLSPTGRLAGFDLGAALTEGPVLNAEDHIEYGPFELSDVGVREQVNALRVFNRALTDDDWAILGTRGGVYLLELAASGPVVHARPAATGGNVDVRAVAGSQFLVDRDPPANVWAAFVSAMPAQIWVASQLGRTSPDPPRNLARDPVALTVAERVPTTGPPDLWSGGDRIVQQWFPTGPERARATLTGPLVALTGGPCVQATLNDLLLVGIDRASSIELLGYSAGNLSTGVAMRATYPGSFVGLTSECIGGLHFAFLSTSRAGTTPDTLRVIEPRLETVGGARLAAARALPDGLLSIGFTAGVDPGEPGPPFDPDEEEEPEPPEGSTMFLHVAVQRLDTM